ncbi:hypothetical protein [Arsenicicoccus dermatophilus]|uniref:hypothetical protein n=1 Tax=Arsenicicoccus dermatophilus TaxID=1076331 RepID=UPI001F4C7F10|nr:hypothetical protein [Arsenicicoccus dermatophilus]MCH8612212.1 hypothetical protein [Arsenicicoccus dermatophilus]
MSSSRYGEQRPRGPCAPALVVGLLGLALAAGVLAGELARVQVDVGRWGPWVAVGVGLVLLVVGAAGIARRTR